VAADQIRCCGFLLWSISVIFTSRSEIFSVPIDLKVKGKSEFQIVITQNAQEPSRRAVHESTPDGNYETS
jgi:hypothetical protein